MSIEFQMCAISAASYPGVVSGEQDWEPTGEGVSLGKAWAVLFRVLNSGEDAANPQRVALAVSGGEHIEAHGDYGGPRVLSPRLVAAIAADLDGSGDDDEDSPFYREALDEQEIRRRFRSVDQSGAYGEGRDVESVLWAFRVLRDFYREAAAAGEAVVICLG